MKESKRKKLEKAGWKVGTVAEFLGLSPEEEMLVEMKVALAAKVKELRQAKKISQAALAKRLGSSQSRVAKAEGADASVSMELLVRSLASLGASQKEIGAIISSRPAGSKLRSRSAPNKATKSKAVA